MSKGKEAQHEKTHYYPFDPDNDSIEELNKRIETLNKEIDDAEK